MKKDVCFKNHVFSEPLGFKDELTVDLWHAQGSSYHAACFLWCTPDGSLPSSLVSSADANLILDLVISITSYCQFWPSLIHDFTFQLSSSRLLEPFEFYREGAVANAQGFSPVLIYNTIIKRDDGSVQNCSVEEDKCQQEYSFKQWHSSSCQFNFVCSQLEENPCGDFGLSLNVGNEDKNEDVCHPGIIHSAELRHKTSVKIGLWQMKSAAIDAQCYAWCTPDGTLPTYQPAGNKNQELLNQLLTNSEKLRSATELSTSGGGSGEAISPIYVYAIKSFQNGAVCDLGDDRCYTTYKFRQVSDLKNVISIIFSQLDGNICGDFGIEILRGNGEIADSSQDLCTPGKLFQADFGEYDFMTVRIWFYSGTSFNITGYVWASADGALPFTSVSSSFASLEQLV